MIKYLTLCLFAVSICQAQHVTTKNIQNGTILNEDISDTAKIDTGKTNAKVISVNGQRGDVTVSGGTADTVSLSNRINYVNDSLGHKVNYGDSTWKYTSYYQGTLKQPLGTYLIPSDSTSIRNRSNVLYQGIGTYLVPSDSTSIRNRSNALYQPIGTYLIPSDSTSIRNRSNVLYQTTGTYLTPTDSSTQRTYSDSRYLPLHATADSAVYVRNGGVGTIDTVEQSNHYFGTTNVHNIQTGGNGLEVLTPRAGVAVINIPHEASMVVGSIEAQDATIGGLTVTGGSDFSGEGLLGLDYVGSFQWLYTDVLTDVRGLPLQPKRLHGARADANAGANVLIRPGTGIDTTWTENDTVLTISATGSAAADSDFVTLTTDTLYLDRGAIRLGDPLGNVFFTDLGFPRSVGNIGRPSVLIGSKLAPLATRDNILIGFQSGDSITTGYDNIGIGWYNLRSLKTGYDNNAVGYSNLELLVDGQGNNAYGDFALSSLVGANSQNSAFGNQAGWWLANGLGNIFVGDHYNSVNFGTTMDSSTIIGFEAGNFGNNHVYGTVLGASSVLRASYATGLGALTSAAFFHSTAVGAEVATTAQNQIMLGTSTDTTVSQFIRLASGTASQNVVTDANRYLTTRASDTVGLAAALGGKQTSGTYLVPTDSTSIRNQSNVLYQTAGTYLVPSDSTSIRNRSNVLYQASGTYLVPSDSTSIRNRSNILYQPIASVTTEGFGFPTIVDTILRGGQSASIAAFNLNNTSVAGFYDAHFSIKTTTAAGTATVTLTVQWDNATKSRVSNSLSLSNVNNYQEITVSIDHSATSGSSVRLLTTVTGSAGAGRYQVKGYIARAF